MIDSPKIMKVGYLQDHRNLQEPRDLKLETSSGL